MCHLLFTVPRTFKDQPCYQGLSRPWIYTEKLQNFQGCVGTLVTWRISALAVESRNPERKVKVKEGPVSIFSSATYHQLVTCSTANDNERRPLYGLALQYSRSSAEVGVELERVQLISVHLVHRRLNGFQYQHGRRDVVYYDVQLTRDRQTDRQLTLRSTSMICWSKLTHHTWRRQSAKNLAMVNGDICRISAVDQSISQIFLMPWVSNLNYC